MPAIPEKREARRAELAAEVLRRFGMVRLRVLGMSMLPTVWPGDVLTVEGGAPGAFVRGDIVLVHRDGRFFVHRLVGARQDLDLTSWVTKGDAVPYLDPPVTASELLGRVSLIERNGRRIAPQRRLTLMTRLLAWSLCRWDRMRSLALRIHDVYHASLDAGRPIV